MDPSRQRLTRARIAAAIVGVLFVGVSVAGVASSASAAPVNQPVFTNPVTGADTDAQPAIEGDLEIETEDVDVVVTVTNSGGVNQFYCEQDNIVVSAPGAFFSCIGNPLPYGDNTFVATPYFSSDVGHTDPGPATDPLLYTRYGVGPVSSTPPASPTTGATLNWSGTGPPLGFVDIVMEDASFLCEHVPVSTAGTWSCEGDPLVPNIYALEVQATDYYGNNPVGDPLDPYNIVIDPPFVDLDQGSIPFPYITADAWQVHGLMSEDIVQIDVYSSTNPGGPFDRPYCSEPNVDPDLTVYYCMPVDNSGLAPGLNYLSAIATNSAGVPTEFSAPIQETLVSRPVILSPGNNTITNDPTPVYSGTADNTYFDTVRVADGPEGEIFFCQAFVAPDDTWSCEADPLPDGEYAPFPETTPNAVFGTRVNIVIDTSAPAPPTINPISTSDTTPTITGTGDYQATVSVYVDGAFAPCTSPAIVDEGANWSCTLVTPLSIGTHTVSARQVDRAGNVGAISVPQPTLVITPSFGPTPSPTPTPNPLKLLILKWTLGGASGEYAPGDAVTLTGTGLPTGAIANAEIHSTPQQLGTALVDATGTFEIDAVIPEDIEPGEHTFVITVTADGAEPSVIEQPVMVVRPEDQKATIPKSDGGEKMFDPPAGGGDEVVDRNAPNAPSAMTSALDTILDIIGNPVVIAGAAAIGLGLLLFVAIPAELLNATLSEQYGRFTKRLPRLKRAPGWWSALTSVLKATPVVGAIAITLLVSIIFGFADPGFGFDLTSLRVVLACALGLLVVGFITNAITGIIVAKRWSLSSRMELKPLGVVLAVIGVVISRLLDFSPGLLIGLLLGIALVGTVSTRDEVRTTLTKGGVLFGFSLVAWLVYSFTSGALVNQSFGANLFLETLVAITAEGLTALAIGLLPFKFLEGESLWNYSKPLWVGVWLFAAAAFALIVMPNNFTEVNGSVWAWGIVVACFALVSVGIYVYFRFFAPPIEEDEDVPEHERIGSRR